MPSSVQGWWQSLLCKGPVSGSMHEAADAGLGLDHNLPRSLCRRLHDMHIKPSHSRSVNWDFNAWVPKQSTSTASFASRAFPIKACLPAHWEK